MYLGFLVDAQPARLRGAERNCRLVKGQVLLWPGARSWLDLWDAGGSIPGWNGYQRS